MTVTDRLMRMFERNFTDPSYRETFGTAEATYDFRGTASPLDKTVFGVVDFHFDRYPLTEGLCRELAARVHAALRSIGIVAPTPNGYLFLSSGAYGQPFVAAATLSQVKTLPHLPVGWADYAEINPVSRVRKEPA